MDITRHYKQLYQSYKDHQHIFIFSIGGRTSSTFLQRALNSSNQICIWGESSGLKSQTMTYFSLLREKHENYLNTYNYEQRDQLISCFEKNKHDVFYPRAQKDLKPIIWQSYGQLTSLLAAEDSRLKRFGFKEIGFFSKKQLEELSLIFPKSKLIFLFRNPLTQWVSVRDSNYFPYSEELSQYLSLYQRISHEYLNLGEIATKAFWVENTDLRDIDRLKKLFKGLGISSFDESLMGNIISSFFKEDLPPPEKEAILASKAFQLYQRMVQLKGISNG